MREYLLSIIIPTKNRQYYCLNSVKQILSCYGDQVEIIVQDNSDNNTLEKQIKELQCDNVIYNYKGGILSFVDNFDIAIGLATGKYMMLIGDDDGVTSLALKVTEWANEKDISSIRPSLNFVYFWPDSQVFKEEDNGILNISTYDGKVQEYDAKAGLITLLKNSCQNYLSCDLIKIYHGIVRRELLDMIKEKTGRFVGGLSPDIYLSVALSILSKGKAINLGVPLTISGICTGSGSSQSATGEHTGKLEDAPHFRGHESYEWDSRIPKFYSVETIWGDSALAAVKDIDPEYLKYYRSETLIYRCLRRYPKYKTEILHNYKANGGNKIRLGSYGFSRLIVKVKCKLLRTQNSEIKMTENDLQNIEEASRICETWIAEHKESTSFENEYTVR